MKIAMKSITLEWTEGRSSSLGKSFDSWEAFQQHINTMRPATLQGYYKSDVVVLFADGTRYQARYDIVGRDRAQEPLRDHIRTHCEFYSGAKCPSHLTQEQYNQVLSYYSPAQQRHHGEFLRNYDV